MRFVSSILPQASGSVGGLVFSHNAGGQYIRARATPTDPGTAAQVSIRGIVASLVNHWVNTLTANQRTAWNVYAANVPLLDVFGHSRYRSGINHYVRSNTPRLQVGHSRIDDGPTTYNLGQYTSPTLTITPATNCFNITFTTTDEWANETGSYLYLWGSKPQNPTINFFKGPYKVMSPIAGDDSVPPTSPAAIGVPYTYTIGQKGFARFNVSRLDGRLSTPFRIGVVTT